MTRTKSQKTDRAQEPVKVAAPGRTVRALKAGAHSKAVHADGSKQSEKNLHKPTSGGNQN
jgi:hypothetical protein